MPNRHAKSITTPNGFTQKPNPFGTIQTNGRNANMFLSITARGYTEYRWLDLYMLNREWFVGPLKDGRINITDLYKSAITGALCLTVSAPIRDEEENIVGVFGVDIRFEDLTKVEQEDQV